MLPATQALWRHLLVSTRDGRRYWRSLHALALDLDVGVSTVHKALAVPTEIGAVRVSRRMGVEVLDPHRLLTLFAAHRRLARDIVAERRVALEPQDVERLALSEGLTVGGFGALVSHLGDNVIASYGTAVVYGRAAFGDDLPVAGNDDLAATRLLVLDADRWLPHWQVVPFAQAYADVFCLPSWQASRFIEQVDPWLLTSREERVIVS